MNKGSIKVVIVNQQPKSFHPTFIGFKNSQSKPKEIDAKLIETDYVSSYPLRRITTKERFIIRFGPVWNCIPSPIHP